MQRLQRLATLLSVHCLAAAGVGKAPPAEDSSCLLQLQGQPLQQLEQPPIWDDASLRLGGLPPVIAPPPGYSVDDPLLGALGSSPTALSSAPLPPWPDRGFASESPLPPLLRPAAAAPHVRGAAEDTGSLASELDSARAGEDALMAENRALREELKSLQYAGLDTSVRGGQAAEFARRSGASPPTMARGGEPEDPGALGLLSSDVQTYVFDAGKEPLDNKSNAVRVLVIFVVANMVTFIGWLVSFAVNRRKRFPYAESAWAPPPTAPGTYDDLPPRRSEFSIAGAGSERPGFETPALAAVEISSLEICGAAPLLGEGENRRVPWDICVAVRASGDTREARMDSAELCDDGVLQYTGSLVVNLQQGERAGQNCVFTVIDRSSPRLVGRERPVARLEMCEKELLRLARGNAGERLGFVLSLEARGSMGRRLSAASSSDPLSLALRLREVPARAASVTGRSQRKRPCLATLTPCL